MMILLALPILLVIVLLIAYNALTDTNKSGEKALCGIGIFIMSALMVATIFSDPLVRLKNANYYLNHQDEFVVDTISVNGVVTELKIREK